MPAAEHLEEDWPAGLISADDLAVKDGVSNAQPLRQRRGERIQMPERLRLRETRRAPLPSISRRARKPSYLTSKSQSG